MNKKMAKLKESTPDPKVVEEAKEIWRVTGTVEESHRYNLFGFMFPLKKYKYVTGMYGDKRVYVYSSGKRVKGRSHGGMDIAAPTGTEVYAAGRARVALAKNRIITGKSVVLEHFPGVYSMYYHLNDIFVTEGDMVEKGDLIGTVGTTGFSTGPHLHWEMRVNNVRIDPLLSVDRLDKVKTIDIR